MENVILLWHNGNFARKVASSCGDIKMIVVNNEESFNKILEICETKVEMSVKDITPKFPEGSPWLDCLHE